MELVLTDSIIQIQITLFIPMGATESADSGKEEEEISK